MSQIGDITNEALAVKEEIDQTVEGLTDALRLTDEQRTRTGGLLENLDTATQQVALILGEDATARLVEAREQAAHLHELLTMVHQAIEELMDQDSGAAQTAEELVTALQAAVREQEA